MHLPNTLVALLMAAPMILATSPASSSATPPIDNVPFKLDQGYKTAGYVTFCGRNTFTEIAGPIYQKNANGIPSTLQVYASSDDASSKMQCNDADSKNTAYGNPNPVVCCISVPESCAAKSSVAQSLDKSILIEANIDCQEEKKDDGYSGKEEEKKDNGY
ncbi:MAG: hypothetical protein DHS80DRAFT_24061 [Piptocephalis tieghemiana]|nr:MAG: hypothetical protein DHS80DRAFT_24061 [Piptocephalis tieghemiana]